MSEGRQTYAILLIIAAAALAPVGDMAAKALSAAYSALFICFARFLIGGALGAAALAATGRLRPPPLKDTGAHIVRAALMAGSTVVLIAALQRAPLADVMAGFYLAPVLASGLSAALFGERMALSRAFGTALSLLGAVAILDPSGAFNLGAAMAIGSGFLFALYLLSAKLAPEYEDAPSAAVFQSLIAAAAMTPLAMKEVAAPPTGDALALFALVGGISVVCQGATLLAHRWAPTTKLAPFFYAALISSLALGAFVFGDIPTPAALFGILSIMIGGAMVACEGRFGGRSASGALARSA